MRNATILAAALMLSAGTALAIARPDAPVAASAPAGDPTHGKHLFIAIGCYQCHGYVGQGAQSTGPALVPLRLSDEAFVGYLRRPRGVMPAFSAKLLPASDARDVLVYVRSLSAGPPARRIALLAPYSSPGAASPSPIAAAAVAAPVDTAAGGKLFAANCAACHGAALQGGIGPKLRGTSLSTEQITAVILNPPAPMPKLSPTPLDGDQVRQVAAYVHAQK